MATYDLKYPGAAIDAILDTAYDLQNAGYIFRGLASEYSNTPTERSWALAGEGETGHGFTSPVPKGYIGVCVFNGTSWTGKLLKCVSIDSAPTSGSTNAVSSGGAYASISQLADTVNEALDNLTFTDTTPSAFLGEYITEKVSTTDGGLDRILTYFTILAATTSKAGLLSAADKAKLDAILGNLRSLEIDDTTAYADLGDKIVESIKATIGGTEETISTFQLLAATASKAGLLSAADKAKLDALWSSGYQFAGIATPSTTPVSTTSKVFYIATEAGTYFNAVTVTQGINLLSWDGTSWSAVQVIGIDDEPTLMSPSLVKSNGILDEITKYSANGNIAFSNLSNEYVPIGGSWIPMVINTANLAVGDTITDDLFVEAGTGIHLWFDKQKYDNQASVLEKLRYRLAGTASYHPFIVLDEDLKVLYISNTISTHDEFNEHIPPFSAYNYRYILFQNFMRYQQVPAIEITCRSKSIDEYISLIPLAVSDYNKILYTDGTVQDVAAGNTNKWRVNRYAIDDNKVYFATGVRPASDYTCMVCYYDSNCIFLGNQLVGSSTTIITEYRLTIPAGSSYVSVAGNQNNLPDLKLWGSNVEHSVLKDVQNISLSEQRQIEENLGIRTLIECIPITTTVGNNILASTGELVDAGTNSVVTNVYEIQDGNLYYGSYRIGTNSEKCSVGYYGENDVFLGFEAINGTSMSIVDRKLNIPVTATTVKITGNKNSQLPVLKQVYSARNLDELLKLQQPIDEFSGKKILCIGNSWGRDSFRNLWSVANAAGVKDFVAAQAYLGGSWMYIQYKGMDDDTLHYRHDGSEQYVQGTYQLWRYTSSTPKKTPNSNYHNGLCGIFDGTAYGKDENGEWAAMTLAEILASEDWDIINIALSNELQNILSLTTTDDSADKQFFNILDFIARMEEELTEACLAKVKWSISSTWSYPVECALTYTPAPQVLRCWGITDWASLTNEQKIAYYNQMYTNNQLNFQKLAKFCGNKVSYYVNTAKALQIGRECEWLKDVGFHMVRSNSDTHLAAGIPKYICACCFVYDYMDVMPNNISRDYIPSEEIDPGTDGGSEDNPTAPTMALCIGAKKSAWQAYCEMPDE